MSVDYEKKIVTIKENLDKAKNLKIRAEARLEQLNRQKEELINELSGLGVKPEDLDTEIEKLKNEIEGLIAKANSIIPNDIINDK